MIIWTINFFLLDIMKKALMTLVLATFALMVKAQGTITGKAVRPIAESHYLLQP